MPGSLSRSLRHGALLFGFIALSVAMTWPLGAHLGTHVVKAKWYYDSMVNLHVLGSRVDYALGRSAGLRSIYDNYFCAPTPYSIANNENHFGLSLLFAPLLLVTGEPLTAYNLLLILCMSLSAFCTFLFVLELTASALAGVLSAVAFAYCPYVFFELGRIQLVATQWIPLFALFLHRSVTRGRTRDLIGLALTFVMQVGSCLYYAMFLVVYGLFVGCALLLRHGKLKPSFVVRLVIAGSVAAVLVLAMVYPNFRAKRDFDLTRSQDLTARYAGKLEHLAHVYPENKTLDFLWQKSDGPDEPIAFPGFTILLLATLAVAWPLVSAYRQGDREHRRKLLVGIGLATLGAIVAVVATFALRTFLAGVVVALAVLFYWRRIRLGRALSELTSLYLTLAVLSLALFLGPTPFYISGSPVLGLYHYLYHYVPGFDGIRYVSRFNILIMLALAVLGGQGAALLVAGPRSVRSSVFFGALLASMLLELRNAPMSLAQLPSGHDLPGAYKWLAKHPGPEPIATIPAYPSGYFGARNDYFALFHKRRTIDGKSSWMPPITYAFINEARRFPRRSTTRLLQALGVKYMVLHLEEWDWARRVRTLEWLDKRPEFYARKFGSDNQFVYEVLPSTDPTTALMPTPLVPSGSVAVSRTQLSALSSQTEGSPRLAIDGNPSTRWSTSRGQRSGDWFEVHLKDPRVVTAIEFDDVDEAFETPGAFKLMVASATGEYTTVLSWPELRIFRDQVYHPKTYVFRVVLPSPTLASAVRIELMDGVAGRRWVIHETKVWAMP